jgi:RNA polymerase-binding transcription factor DksA
MSYTTDEKKHFEKMMHQALATNELELTDIGYLHAHDGSGFVGAPHDTTADPADVGEMGNIDSVQETNKAIALELVARNNEIVAALNALQEGTYGTCSHCSKPIELKRLHAHIAATTCISCA